MKRGISPVIATTLLIAIAVIAGMSIYFWAAGQNVSAPTRATFIDITVSPVNVTDGTFIVTNMGGEYIELASLNSAEGMTCDFGGTIILAPGETAQCTIGATPFCEMNFYGPGTTTATTIMGGDCNPMTSNHVPVITFIGEDTGGSVELGIDVNFTATVTDVDGNLDTVMLYTNITGAMTPYTMAPAGGNDFTVSLNASDAGIIRYYAWANDTTLLTDTNGTYDFDVGGGGDPLDPDADGPYSGNLSFAPRLLRSWTSGATDFKADYDEYCIRFQPINDADHDVIRLGAEFNTSTQNATLKLRSGGVGNPPGAILQSCTVASGQTNVQWRFCDITPQTVTKDIGYWFCVCSDTFVGSATDSRNGTCAALPVWSAGLEAPNFQTFEAGNDEDGYEIVIDFWGNATGGTSPYSYVWDFDDEGCSPAGDCEGDGGRWPSHTYTWEGVYTVNLTVTDSALDTDSETSQVTISGEVDPWTASFDSGRDEMGYTAIDGSLYTVGYQEDSGVGWNDVFVSKLNNTDGTEYWNSTHSCGGFHDQGLDMILLSDGGLAVAGTCGTVGDQDAWALKLDSDGNHDRNATFDSTGEQDYFMTVIEDGTDLVFAGINQTTIYRGLIVKYDEDLIEQWNVTFNESGAFSRVDDIVKVSDGYVAVGTANAENDLFLWKVDKATGATIWSVTHDHLGANRGDSGLAIIELDAGGFAVAGYNTNAGSENDIWILSLDSGGAIDWNVTYDGGSEHDFGYGIVEVGDGLVAGGYMHNGADYDYWARKVAKADGATIWTKTYDNGGNDDYGYSLEKVSPGGFVMAGMSNVAGNFNMWIVRLNQTGHAAP